MSSFINQYEEAANSCGLKIYGHDFLCRAMAILYCYGGGPGGEYFRTPLGQHIACRASEIIESAVSKKDWNIIKLFQRYVHELQINQASWLNETLFKLNIPENVISYRECFGARQ